MSTQGRQGLGLKITKKILGWPERKCTIWHKEEADSQ
jgi:hypothetical protein